MKEIESETKLYLVTARDNRGVQYWVSEKEYNDQVVLKVKAQSIEPVMSEGKNPEPICQVVKVEKVKQYKMVDKTGGIACWVEAADVVEKKGLGWRIAPGEVDPDGEKPYYRRTGVIERANGR